MFLTSEHREHLRRHAVRCEPLESCALLFGKINDQKIIIDEILVTENAADSPVRFAIPDEDLIRAYAKAEDQGTSIVGVFHSHPSSEAVPSNTDEKFMLINPVAWVIYSGTERRFRAYVLDGQVQEIPIV